MFVTNKTHHLFCRNHIIINNFLDIMRMDFLDTIWYNSIKYAKTFFILILNNKTILRGVTWQERNLS